jgi:hypothetical protein
MISLSGDGAVETPEVLAARVRQALKYPPPERGSSAYPTAA